MNPNAAVRSRTGHDKITSVETPDEYTVVMTLGEPFAPFQSLWIGGVTSIIPAHILEGVEDFNTAPFNSESPIGTGSLQIRRACRRGPSDGRSEHQLPPRRAANPAHHRQAGAGGAKPSSRSSRTARSTWSITRGSWPSAGKKRWLWRASRPFSNRANFVEFIYFNNSLPQFQDKRVKKAIYHAIDRQTIMDVIYFGLGAHRNLSAAHALGVQPGRQNLSVRSRAGRALLDEAGFVPGDDGVRANDDVRLAFSMSTSAGNASSARAPSKFCSRPSRRSASK